MDRRAVSGAIRQARERAGLRQGALAKQVGCTSPYITMLEKGRSLPSPEMAVRLERALRLKSGVLLQLVLGLRIRDIGHGTSEINYRVNIPLLQACPSSPIHVSEDEVDEWVELTKSIVRGRRMYLLRVQGDSMNKAGLEDGDLVLVDADADPRNGDIVAARLDGQSTVKRFVRTDQQLTLTPESTSPHHQPSICAPAAQPIRGVVEAIYLKRLK